MPAAPVGVHGPAEGHRRVARDAVQRRLRLDLVERHSGELRHAYGAQEAAQTRKGQLGADAVVQDLLPAPSHGLYSNTCSNGWPKIGHPTRPGTRYASPVISRSAAATHLLCDHPSQLRAPAGVGGGADERVPPTTSTCPGVAAQPTRTPPPRRAGQVVHQRRPRDLGPTAAGGRMGWVDGDRGRGQDGPVTRRRFGPRSGTLAGPRGAGRRRASRLGRRRPRRSPRPSPSPSSPLAGPTPARPPRRPQARAGRRPNERGAENAGTPGRQATPRAGDGRTGRARAGRARRRPGPVLLAVLLVPVRSPPSSGSSSCGPTGGPAPAAARRCRSRCTARSRPCRHADCSPGDGQGRCAALVVAMTDGPRAGRDLVQIVPLEPGTPRFTVGDPVVLGWSGGDPDDPGSYQVVDFQRGGSLLWLAGLFAAAVLVLGRWRGLAALGGAGVGFAVLLLFVLPAILDGRDPLAVAVVGSGVIMFAVLYLTHGLSARTSTAVLGTLVSLALIGALGVGVLRRRPAHRPRRPDHRPGRLARHRASTPAACCWPGWSSAPWACSTTSPSPRRARCGSCAGPTRTSAPRALFRSAMRIGRDHVASAVNTLVLAYAGARCRCCCCSASPARSLGDVATSQDVATEIVRTLVGSSGSSPPCRSPRRSRPWWRSREATDRAAGERVAASPSLSRSSSKTRAARRRSSPGPATTGPAPADLGQHGHREQPARGRAAARSGVTARVAEPLAHHDGVRPRGSRPARRRGRGRSSGSGPRTPCGGERSPGRQPGRGDVDGVDRRARAGPARRRPAAAPARHVQGSPRHRGSRRELGLAPRRAARRRRGGAPAASTNSISAPAPRRGAPRVPPLPVVRSCSTASTGA